MDIAEIARWLDDPQAAVSIANRWGISDLQAARRALAAIHESGVPLDLLGVLADRVGPLLPASSDPDRVLALLERFITSSRSPLAVVGYFDRDPDALATLVHLFSASQNLGEQLVRDPETFDLVRVTDGHPVERETLIREIAAEVAAAELDERAAMAALRRVKRRETLRIAYGDLTRQQSIETVTRQISYLADALVEAALRFAKRKLEESKPSFKVDQRFAVIALGKLGGLELNYSSDVDLVFLFEGPNEANKRAAAQERCDRLARTIIRLLSEQTEDGFVYRVDVRLRPHGTAGPLASALDDALIYYDTSGRTWERQTLIKARGAAGDMLLARDFLSQIEPWVYRRYLSRADIGGIQALKRRIERWALREGADGKDVKTGRGGLRDIEFTVQFLQLLNGGDVREIHTGNTLEAIRHLQTAGCLTPQERSELETNYALLRKIEHRLQLMFDGQTHRLPDDETELRRLAIRCGYSDTAERTGDASFREDYERCFAINRRVLDHLLHAAFPNEPETEAETDLILDPDPAPEAIEAVMSKYHFAEPPVAFSNLTELGSERVRFLSTRRCRHFLASIAPRLLAAVAATPDPDFTLANLTRVSDSLGGKGVLWELFSFAPATLKLYVRLCGASRYLSDILVSSPGMLDELLDSLLLGRLPDANTMTPMLREWTRSARELGPTLHGFKESMHLCIGVRDLLGKDESSASRAALSDTAEVILQTIVDDEYAKLVDRLGVPVCADGPRAESPAQLAIVALGKFGGREPNYHSDLDVMFLYDGDGNTRQPIVRQSRPVTTNAHFFAQLAQRVIQAMGLRGPHGKLYEVDTRLRPGGNAAPLAVSLTDFAKRHAEGLADPWERQTLTKARCIYGDKLTRISVQHTIRQAIVSRAATDDDRRSLLEMRRKMEAGAHPLNLKRAAGGTVDIEFAAQWLQLQHAARSPNVLWPGTLAALSALNDAKLLSPEQYSAMRDGYTFLRRVESGLRLMNTTSRHTLPEDERELKRLAFLIRYPNADQLADECRRVMARNREIYLNLVG